MGRAGKKGELGNSLLSQGKKKNESKTRHSIKNPITDEKTQRLKSIIEENDIDELMHLASLSNRDFTASKQNIAVVTESDNKVFKMSTVDGNEMQEITLKDQEIDFATKDLPIPKRPKWKVGDTKETLIEREQQAFLEWRRILSKTDEQMKVTPYEKNLNVWKQLWRVVERSDIVCQIVDSRNPLLFRSKHLELYIKEVDSSKEYVLLLNKADLLSPLQRKMWADYLTKKEIPFKFFSAVLPQDDDEEEEEEPNLDLDEENTKIKQKKAPKEEKIAKKVEEEDEASKILSREELLSYFESRIEFHKRKHELLMEQRIKLHDRQKTQKFKNQKFEGIEPEKEEGEKVPKTEDMRSKDLFFSSKELKIQHMQYVVDKKKKEHDKDEEDQLKLLLEPKIVIGFVGYPNVGKSSVINMISQKKCVGVAPTPGKTKHFQTIFLTKEVMLCDSPGLVFPSLANSKEQMLCDGILPIDQMREYQGAINLICKRIPTEVFEFKYGIRFLFNQDNKKKNKKVVLNAEQLLGGFCNTRGLMSMKCVPNYPAAARIMLKDYTTGALLYCHPPPNDDIEVPKKKVEAKPVKKVEKETKKIEKEEIKKIEKEEIKKIEEEKETKKPKEEVKEEEEEEDEEKEEDEEEKDEEEEEEDDEEEKDEDYETESDGGESYDEETDDKPKRRDNKKSKSKSKKRDADSDEEKPDAATKTIILGKSDEALEQEVIDSAEIDPTLAEDDELVRELNEKKSRITVGIDEEGERIIFRETEVAPADTQGFSVKKDAQIRKTMIKILEKATDKAETIARLRQREDLTKAEKQYLKTLKRSALTLKGKNKMM